MSNIEELQQQIKNLEHQQIVDRYGFMVGKKYTTKIGHLFSCVKIENSLIVCDEYNPYKQGLTSYKPNWDKDFQIWNSDGNLHLGGFTCYEISNEQEARIKYQVDIILKKKKEYDSLTSDYSKHIQNILSNE